MKFKIDQNQPSAFVESLRNLGYDALTVYDQNLSGAEDPKDLSKMGRS